MQARQGALFAWIWKVTFLFLCLFGISFLHRLTSSFIYGTDKSPDGKATEDRRARLYIKRWNHTLEICSSYEEEITLHTVKMYDLVPPAPIAINADLLVDWRRQYFWCKVPKAASTSWMSLIL